MAECVLQLARPTFPRIGALVESSPGTYEVLGRPITLNMNNMFQLSNIPPSVFPPEGTTYSTADQWYAVLAEMQMATLVFQHNDIISSEADCRTKYIARKLFHRLAKQKRLTTFGFCDDDWSACSEHSSATLPSPDSSGSFRLWSDDFRPVNVLVSEGNDVVGAIDWEFAYVGPLQLWDDGIEDWASTYERRFETWLSAIEECEKEHGSSLRLSAYMRESWATGRFWLNYAARKSWSFDTIYWKHLDERFFGKRAEDTPPEDLWRTRVELLTEDERQAMDVLVKTKMEESRERVLIDWDAEKARQHLSCFLVT